MDYSSTFRRGAPCLRRLEGSATTGGDVGEAVLREAEVAHGGGGVAATDDGERTGCGGVDQTLGHGLGAGGELKNLEHAHRAVPHDGLGVDVLSWKKLDSGPMSRPHLVGRDGVGGNDFRSNRGVTGREAGVHDDVGRQHSSTPFFSAVSM